MAPAPLGQSSRLQVDLEEYRALRAELLTRIGKQQEITGFAIAIFAALAAVSQFVGPDRDALATAHEFLWAMPVVSIILSTFTLMTLEYEVNIAHILVYTDTILKPRVAAELKREDAHPGWEDVLEWNVRRAEWQQHAGMRSLLTESMASAKYAATIVPNVAVVWFYIQNAAWREVASRDGVPFWGASTLLVVVGVSAFYTSSVYLRMNRGDSGPVAVRARG